MVDNINQVGSGNERVRCMAFSTCAKESTMKLWNVTFDGQFFLKREFSKLLFYLASFPKVWEFNIVVFFEFKILIEKISSFNTIN